MEYKKVAFLLILSLLAACSSSQVSPVETKSPAQPQQSTQPSPTAQPTSTSIPPAIKPAPTEIPAPRFPSEPQRIEFKSEDGVKLVGYYYPAAIEPAPILVLMHWLGGSNCDWLSVNLIQWAQNRNLPEGTGGNPVCANAKTPFTLSLNEYPPLPAAQAFAVFAFDYRGHGESAGSANWDTEGWLKDSIAAVKEARALPGVDSERAATIGASIGADGAIDGCGEGCLGALSFSPGNYLGVKYVEAVNMLSDEKKPAWCIVSQKDGESFPNCEAASGDYYKKIAYAQSAHGMAFFQSDFDPKTAQNIFNFLQTVFVR